MTEYTDDELKIRDGDLQTGVWVRWFDGKEHTACIVGKRLPAEGVEYLLDDGDGTVWKAIAWCVTRLSRPSEVPEQHREQWAEKLATLRPRTNADLDAKQYVLEQSRPTIDPHQPVEGVTLWNSHGYQTFELRAGCDLYVDGVFASFVDPYGREVLRGPERNALFPCRVHNPNRTIELLTAIRDRVRAERAAKTTLPEGVELFRYSGLANFFGYVRIDGEDAGWLYPTGDFHHISPVQWLSPREITMIPMVNPLIGQTKITIERLIAIRDQIRAERAANAASIYTASTFPSGEVWMRSVTWQKNPTRRCLVTDVTHRGVTCAGADLAWTRMANSWEISTDGGKDGTWRKAMP